MTKYHATTGWVLEKYHDHEASEKEVSTIYWKQVITDQFNYTIMEIFITKEIDSTEIAPTFGLEHSYYALGSPQT